MRKRRIYHILSLLSEEESRRFRDFLVSPLFSKRKRLLRFFELWKERIIDNEGADLSPEDFVRDTAFSVSGLDKLCSQLYRHCLEFMALQEYQASEALNLTCAAQALEKRTAPETEIQRHNERHLRWLNGQEESANKEMEKLSLGWRMAEARTRARETQILWKEDFRDLHELLDGYYYLQKLKLASASANARHMYKQDEDPAAAFLNYFRESVSKKDLPPLTLAYYHTIEMLSRTDGLEPFQALTAILQEHSAAFHLEEARELYHYALNFCIRKTNQGELVYKKYTGALYRDLLEKGLLLINGKLPPQTMKNIVVIHCGLGQLDWTEKFIDEYSKRLTEGADPALITYNKAVLAFFREDYGQAISALKEVISQLKNDIFYELDARIYLWKSYFEDYANLDFEEVDELERMYDAFRILIDRNNKLSNVHKSQYRNFIRAFKRLLVLKQQAPPLPEKLIAFREEIGAMELIFARSWFLEKASQMIGGENS